MTLALDAVIGGVRDDVPACRTDDFVPLLADRVALEAVGL